MKGRTVTNVVAVLLASLGLLAAVWGASGSLRAAVCAAGVLLLVGAVAVVLDVEGLT